MIGRVVQGTVATVAMMLVACAGPLERTAAPTLHCPAGDLDSRQLGESTRWEVRGCGRKAVYVQICEKTAKARYHLAEEGILDGRACEPTWRIRAGVAPIAAQQEPITASRVFADLGCTDRNVELREQDARTLIASGCGASVTYSWACRGDQCRWDTLSGPGRTTTEAQRRPAGQEKP